jgi:2-polyprenyl-3-methyl-5-hydroxy-6-metoxy-1,4-benzoquinol methylase
VAENTGALDALLQVLERYNEHMSRSYQADEKVFQQLRAAGKTSWDEQADPEASFDKFVMRPFLEESLAEMPQGSHGRSALEVGCGSGPICCFLAARGWAVRGIDVSQTALEMAQRNADQRGLTVQFDAADICGMPAQPDRYDLVIDGHCLHCLVRDEHRREALTAVHRLLKPDGLFLIETMISHPALIVKGNYRIDPQGVLSIKVDDATGHDDTFQSDSEWFTPYRRLLTADQIATELRNTGFTIQSQRTMEQKDSRKPMLMQIRAGRCAD